MTNSLRDCFDRLNEDRMRRETPFSPDILETSDVLLHPYATENERCEAMNLWLGGRNQPCLFGRIAAKAGGIEFCFVDERDILDSDRRVSQKIYDARQLWKRRALRGGQKSGFMLVVASRRVLNAMPDSRLQEFSACVQQLAGWPVADDVEGHEIVSEWLYIQNPADKSYARFEFSVDYFASAADGRWWHDHRIPGGIAFTANSLGHMIKVNEWYQRQANQIEWALRTAMLTIDSAKVTSQGAATWLIDESKSGPFKPFEWKEDGSLPDLEKLKDKDHGSYAGYLHTDHAIRSEFFGDAVVPPRKLRPWAMDFSYIFDSTSPDHEKFVAGTIVTEDEVTNDLGRPGDWRVMGADSPISETSRPPFVEKEILELLNRCRIRAAAEE